MRYNQSNEPESDVPSKEVIMADMKQNNVSTIDLRQTGYVMSCHIMMNVNAYVRVSV